ncbi:hypothetical protein BZG36_01712 [Bifiguratus adelaidae]|uniref:4-hydroxy-2-oxoglutarate aldolase, mitochondrial n=1 Tax=Bifiguratus adelaidae TaxID=1938954 RepID=A0A261Y4N7_9FUNG|nr:hypothetical protein BZG36_01712 [Bifiguratus adelaidae]
MTRDAKTISKGVYPPLPTFFKSGFDAQGEKDMEALDLDTLGRHIRFVSDGGCSGVVLLGTNGEATHISSDERVSLISAARQAIEAHNPHMILIVGTGAQSTRETIANCKNAAAAGADYCLVLPPSYFKSRMSNDVLFEHYQTVAEASPVPCLIYNMPAATGGLDIDASLCIRLAKECPNIVGIKDSSGNVVKASQIVEAVSGLDKPAGYQGRFAVLAGSGGFYLPFLSVGAIGAVPAIANIMPKAICKIHQLFNEKKWEEARQQQASVVTPNAAVTTQFSVPGLKAALQQVRGYGGLPRRPLQPLKDTELGKLQEVFAFRNDLA